MKLLVTEIFRSIEGETTTAGFPALFIRLAGCNLDCRWCDTPEAKSGGVEAGVEDLAEIALSAGVHHVTVTGGEPLCQEGSIDLMESLAGSGMNVQLETNGSISAGRVPARVRKIVDVKTPSSGEELSFCAENCGLLLPGDEVKFVIADDRDYSFALDFIKGRLENSPAVMNFSPAHGSMTPERLAGMIVRDRAPVRLNLQLHCVIWGDREGKIILPFPAG